MATWNPSDKHADIVLSNGNLTARIGSGDVGPYRAVRADVGKASGKWYWEVTISIGTPYPGNNSPVGVATAEAVLQATKPHPGADAASYGTNRIYKFHSGTGTSYGGDGYGSGDVVLGTALDLDNGKIWWSFNGAWMASGNPAAGTYPAYTGLAGTFYPMVGIWDTASPATVNFGATPFTYSPPTGFSALAPPPVLFSCTCAAVTSVEGALNNAPRAKGSLIVRGAAVFLRSHGLRAVHGDVSLSEA